MHSSHPSEVFVCGVEHCQDKFYKAISWYWHIRRVHGHLYCTGKRKRSQCGTIFDGGNGDNRENDRNCGNEEMDVDCDDGENDRNWDAVEAGDNGETDVHGDNGRNNSNYNGVKNGNADDGETEVNGDDVGNDKDDSGRNGDNQDEGGICDSAHNGEKRGNGGSDGNGVRIGSIHSDREDSCAHLPRSERQQADVAMGWLIKLSEVHRISEFAINDVLHMCTDLHLYIIKLVQDALPTLTSSEQSNQDFNHLIESTSHKLFGSTRKYQFTIPEAFIHSKALS